MRYRTLFLTGFLIGGAVSAGDVVINGDLEGGWAQSAWEITDNVSGVTLCHEETCGTGAFDDGPRSGDFWLWFGTISFGLEREQNVTQALQIPEGATTLSFWMKTNMFDEVHFGELQVRMDDMVLERYELPPVPKVGYRQQSIDISQFADGQTHELRFRAVSDSGLGGVGWQMDDISIIGCDLVLEPGKTIVSRGSTLPFRVRVKHHRLQTVTVPILAEVKDWRGEVVAEFSTHEMEMPYQSQVIREHRIPVPAHAEPGEYTLNVCVDQMSGDQNLCRSAPFQVTAFEG